MKNATMPNDMPQKNVDIRIIAQSSLVLSLKIFLIFRSSSVKSFMLLDISCKKKGIQIAIADKHIDIKKL